MQTLTRVNEDFVSSLMSGDRSADIEPAEDIYAPLLGNWKLKMIDYYRDGRTQRDHSGTWFFARTLEGRAIQDVLVSPEFAGRSKNQSTVGNRYGNTFRMMHPKTRQWHINWFNPVSGIHNQLIARMEGERIIQETTEMNAPFLRWTFEDITADSFHWFGESSFDKGKTSILEVEFFAERIKSKSV